MDGRFPNEAPRAATRGARVYALLSRFEQPRFRRGALLLALLLVVPSLFSGFAADDYLMLYRLRHPLHNEWAGSLPLELFKWTDPAHDRALIDGHGLGWWTLGDTRIAFLRPVTSLTHALDLYLWPDSAFVMHLQNLLWFTALLGLAYALYAQLVESRFAAGLATALFAFDSGHGFAVGWISNRNALTAGAFALLALYAHHRSRSARSVPFAIAAPVCFALSLFSGELAVGLLGYLLSYALFIARAPWPSRLRSLLPFGALFGVWAVVRRAAHYGVWGLGGYVDPVAEPLAFSRVLPARWLELMSGQLFRVSSDVYGMLPDSLVVVGLAFALALALCALGLWFVWPSLRAERNLRFWMAGAGLSALPLAAGAPSDRLLTLVGLGVMPVLAHAIRAPLVHSGSARGRRLCASYLVFAHVLMDPLALPLTAMMPSIVAGWGKQADDTMPRDAKLRDQTVIVAEIPDSALLSYVPAMRAYEGRSQPEHLYWLLSSRDDARVERRAPNVLRVSAPSGFFDPRFEQRNACCPFHVGDRVELSEMTIYIVALTKDGRPAVCDFVFVQPLDSQHYRWLTWRRGGLRPLRLPRDGERATLSDRG